MVTPKAKAVVSIACDFFLYLDLARRDRWNEREAVDETEVGQVQLQLHQQLFQ